MHISHLQLTHFRNYLELDINFCPGINCISGMNGSGKTNVLDALHYLALTKGFRSSKDKQALKEGETIFFIEAEIEKEGVKQSVQCNFLPGKGKKILVNQQPLSKMSEHIGNVPMVAVLPNDTELINGPSAKRRRFLDVLISQYDHTYLSNLIQYERILGQRNALLKLFAQHQSEFDREQLELWNTQLIPHGISLLNARKAFIKEYQPIFREFFKKIVSRNEVPKIEYQTQVQDNSINGWLRLLDAKEEKDLILQYTSAGIHRDDLVFSINGNSARNFGSQGQQKTFVIALKLGQYKLLEQHKMTPPILLLDDIFDKLDEHRLGSIAALLDREIDGQVFVTDTSHQRLSTIFQNPINSEVAYYRVDEGQIEKAE